MARGANPEKRQIGLLKASDDERLDTRATTKASADSHMETVGAVHPPRTDEDKVRTAHNGFKGERWRETSFYRS